MVTISLSELQKNIGIIGGSNEPINIIDRRRNRKIGVFYPENTDKKSILDIGASIKPKKEILDKTKNISWSDIRKQAINIQVKNKYKGN